MIYLTSYYMKRKVEIHGKKSFQSSKTFQKRPKVPQHVLQRLIDLKNQGMGFIKISKQLKKEGIATLSKSTVANCWYWHQGQSKISTKKLQKNPVLKNLANKEARLQKEASQIQEVKGARQRILNLQLERAETPEGRQKIFKNSEELKEFAQQTLPEYTLKDFELICKEKGLPIAKTLSDVVEPLEKYEEENEDLCWWPDLSSCIKEKIDTFVESEQHNKKRQQLQKKFSDFWINFRCGKCDTPYYDMFILKFENVIACRCGEWTTPKCLECGNRLIFDADKDAFACRKCNAIFKLPIITCHYTFLKEHAR